MAACALAAIVLASGPRLSLADKPADSRDQPGLLAGGKTFRGQLVGADDGRLMFRVASGDRTATETIPAAQLVRWGQLVETSRGAQLLLVDGSLLVGQLVSIENGQITIRSDLAGEVRLPSPLVLAVLVHPPADPHRRDQLVARLEAAESAPAAGDDAAAHGDRAILDRAILDNGDQLDGSVVGWHNDVLALETDAGRTDLEAARVTAIQFRGQPDRDQRPSGRRVLIVGLSDGSRLSAGQLVADAAATELTLAGPAAPLGAQRAASVSLKFETSAITALQPLGGQVVYLSDLEPVGYKHIPFLQLNWPYGTDRSADGDLLRAGGKLFLKGLGMHSASRITYDLPRPASRLEAALAVDDRAKGRGSVVFRVFVDTGDGRWDPKFTSPTIRGGDPPLPITVDLTKAKRISLLVEFADRGDELDYADWLDARLIP